MKPSKKIQEFIVKKAFSNWADDNTELIEDAVKLADNMMEFEEKYGFIIKVSNSMCQHCQKCKDCDELSELGSIELCDKCKKLIKK